MKRTVGVKGIALSRLDENGREIEIDKRKLFVGKAQCVGPRVGAARQREP